MLVISFQAFTQSNYAIEQMKWDKDFEINIRLSNDSNYVFDVKELHHIQEEEKEKDSYTYYPVRLGDDFVEELKTRSLGSDNISKSTESSKTLWSALHYSIGGDWTHFLNCVLYSLEIGQLDITAPLMQRPESNWKPSPMTESYKRTRKWQYYSPVDHKLAIKEYKIKKSNGELGDIKDVPTEFIELFLSLNQKEYLLLKEERKIKDLAKIDLIKILLGANYLGETQIKYIKSMVLKAMTQYSDDKLPSIIIFDNFNAAVAMNLNEKGYQIEKIVFGDELFISVEEKEQRIRKIKQIISHINEVNKTLFQKKLEKYYQ